MVDVPVLLVPKPTNDIVDVSPPPTANCFLGRWRLLAHITRATIKATIMANTSVPPTVQTMTMMMKRLSLDVSSFDDNEPPSTGADCEDGDVELRKGAVTNVRHIIRFKRIVNHA
jgi:hypothetical protein